MPFIHTKRPSDRWRTGARATSMVYLMAPKSPQRPPALHTVRLCLRVVAEAFLRFSRDDGWAIASHISLSTLMAMFPFLIVVTALAGIPARQSRQRSRPPDLRRLAEAGGGTARERNSQRAHDPAQRRPDIGRRIRRLFSSSGVESLRIGLNRAYGLTEQRSWWVLRPKSIGYVLVGPIAFLALAFLVVLGPLIFQAAVAYAPWMEPLKAHYDIARFGIGGLVVAGSLVILRLWLPAGRRDSVTVRRASSRHWRCGFLGFILGRYLADFPSLRHLLCRTGLGDDRADVFLLQRLDFISAANSTPPWRANRKMARTVVARLVAAIDVLSLRSLRGVCSPL